MKLLQATHIANMAEQKMQNANAALNMATNSNDYIEIIRELLEDMKSSKLMHLAETTWDSTEDLREEISAAISQYSELRSKFDQFKEENSADLARKVSEFKKHQTDLMNYERTRKDLASQVANLEEIRDTMPNWCTKESNINEAAGPRRNSRRGSVISEQP